MSVSNISGTNQWRKESVTIIESQEPMDEDNEENEGDVESDGADKVEKKKGDLKAIRRLSCSLESNNEGQFLSVPHATITASSSAETLTDNTITAPSTPTNLTVNRSVAFILCVYHLIDFTVTFILKLFSHESDSTTNVTAMATPHS